MCIDPYPVETPLDTAIGKMGVATNIWEATGLGFGARNAAEAFAPSIN
jgi:hypothetical protein